jgi:hypothetical protein
MREISTHMDNELFNAALRVLNAWERRQTPDPADEHALLNTALFRGDNESSREVRSTTARL